MDAIATLPLQSGSNDPKSYAEALLRPDADRWIEAWEIEKKSILLTSLASPITYSQLPPDAVVIDSMAVFKKKIDGRHKVRIVLRGDRQPAESVSDNLYAPTVRITILRAFLAIVSTAGLFLNTMDVKSAFCQTPLQPGYTPTYVRFPKGTRENIMGLLYLLLCSLYGLRDAPCLWYLFWTNILRKLGFVQSRVDPCLWRRGINTPAEISLLFWVDDSITATHSQAVFESFCAEISKQIDLTRSAVNRQFTLVCWYFCKIQSSKEDCFSPSDSICYHHPTTFWFS